MSSTLATQEQPQIDPLAFLDRTEVERPSQKPQEKIEGELHGFYYDMPYDVYAAVPALNASKVMHMRRSPMKFKHELDNPTPPSPAMEMGSIVHRMILEPHAVGNVAIYGQEANQKVRNGRVWDEFRDLHKDEIILTVKEANDAFGMTKMALENAPLAKYAKADGPCEVSIFWRDPFTGRRKKARIDKIITDGDILFDLKSTADCHSYRFGATAYRLGYHMKMAHYAEGYEVLTGRKPRVVLGALDNKAPFEAVIYRIPNDVLLQGADEIRQLIERITECENSGNWSGEYADETDLILPHYAYENGDFETEDAM